MLNNIVCNSNTSRTFQVIFIIFYNAGHRQRIYNTYNFIGVSSSMKNIYLVEHFHYTKVLYNALHTNKMILL